MNPQHPSFLDLDRAALGELDDESIHQHLERCARCRTHVERVTSAEMTPAWARLLADTSRPKRRVGVWIGGTLAAAAALFLFILLRSGEGSPAGTTTVKGSAAVAVYVKRDHRVELWDGVTPLKPADAIRLEIVPDGYRYVGIYSIAGAELIELYNAPLPSVDEPTLVPRAWEVDAAPGPETLVIALSHEPVTEGDLQALRNEQRGIWLQRLTLPKDLAGTSQP